MAFRLKRSCRIRLLWLLVVFISLFFLTKLWFAYTPLSEEFVELKTCPACFGISLCDLCETDDIQLSGWERYSFFNNDQFNIKNIYYGTLRNQPVIFKKFAHRSEWLSFDNCRQNASCNNQLKQTLKTFIPCSDHTFISKFQMAYISSTGFDRHDAEISLDTTIQVNLEPLVLSFLSSIGLPIPIYYGACGRVGVISYEGLNLVSYLKESFQFRAFLARELLISMHELNTGNEDMIIYYGDVNLENFVYNENQRRVKMIDLEYVIILERNLFDDTNDQREILHSNKYCTTYMPDYNVKQICRSVLLPATEINDNEWSSDFLHSTPEYINHQWNLTNIIKACARTESTNERLALYEQLLKILNEIM